MPLLGRNKSSPGCVGGANGQPIGGSQPLANSKSQQQHLVCQSPMFGIRRQLPITSSMSSPGHSIGGVNNQTTGADKTKQPSKTNSNIRSKSYSTSSTTTNNTGAISKQPTSNPTKDNNNTNQTIEHELNSIPYNITRQQIHYAFSIMDTNSDGLIGLRDLSQMLANLGILIDEAILSHVISGVSKQGNHLISEQEFLAWIGDFIQVCDSPSISGGGGGTAATTTPKATPAAPTAAGRQPRQQHARSPMVRSPTAGASLATGEPEAPPADLRRRRGSGSGLVLMRALSSGATSGHSAAAAAADSAARPSPGAGAATSGRRRKLSNVGAATSDQQQQSVEDQVRNRRRQEELEQDSRNDLRAAFCVFDLDGDGYITLDEVRAGLRLLGETWSQAELNQVFSSCSSKSAPTTSIGQQQLAAKGSANLFSGRHNKSATMSTGGGSVDMNNNNQQQQQRISIDDFVRLLL